MQDASATAAAHAAAQREALVAQGLPAMLQHMRCDPHVSHLNQLYVLFIPELLRRFASQVC
jgi:hypothetical protein